MKQRNKKVILICDKSQKGGIDRHKNFRNNHNNTGKKIILNFLYTIRMLDDIDFNIEILSTHRIIGDNDNKLEINIPGMIKNAKLIFSIIINVNININKLLNNILKTEKNKENVIDFPEEMIVIKLIILPNKIVLPIKEENIFDIDNSSIIFFCSALISLIILNNEEKVVDVISYKKDIFFISGVIKVSKNITKKVVKHEINIIYAILLQIK